MNGRNSRTSRYLYRNSVPLLVLLLIFGFIVSSSGKLLFDSPTALAAPAPPPASLAPALHAPVSNLTIQVRDMGGDAAPFANLLGVRIAFYDSTGIVVFEYTSNLDASGNTSFSAPNALDDANSYYIEVSGNSLNTAGYANQYHNGKPTRHSSTALGLADGLTEGGTVTVNLAPQAGDTALTLQDQFGTPIANTYTNISIFDAADDANTHCDLWVTTDDAGSYTITAGDCNNSLPSDASYRVRYQNLTNVGFNNQWHDSATDPAGMKTTHADATDYTPTDGPNTLVSTLERNTIRGTLTDHRTGNPIANASGTVTVYEDNGSGDPNWWSLGTDTFQTNAAGEYVFLINSEVTAGPHYLEFSNIDTNGDGSTDFYPNQWHSAADAPAGYKNRTDATSFPLTPGETTVATALEPYITIVGTLTDHRTGNPLANANVSVRVDDDPIGLPSSDFNSTTDANGTYTVTLTQDPVPGNYYLQFSNIDTDGVVWTYEYPDQWHNAAADPAGHKDDANATVVALNPGINNVATALEPYITIVGTLTDHRTGDPIANASVYVSAYNDPFAWSSVDNATITTDANGKYQFVLENINPPAQGNYYLQFNSFDANGDGVFDYPYQWHDAAADPAGGKDSTSAISVTLSPGPNPVATALDPAIQVVGTLTDYATGLPIASASGNVAFYDENNSYVAQQDITTDATGTYTVSINQIRGAANYYLRFSSFSDYPDQRHNAAADPRGLKDDSNHTPQWLAPGTQAVTTTLVPYTTIQGTLTDLVREEPIANAYGRIVLCQDEYNCLDAEWVTTDEDGKYTARFQIPVEGDYYFRYERFDVYNDGFEEYPEQWYNAATNPRGIKEAFYQATPKALVVGTNTVDAALEPYITIHGTLTDYKTVEPISNTNGNVVIRNRNGNSIGAGDFRTDVDGNYVVTLTTVIPAGEYRLFFRGMDDYPDQYHNASGDPEGYKEDQNWAEFVNLAPGDNNVDTDLDPYITIEGTLTDAISDDPIANTSGQVRIRDKNNNWLESANATTDANGKYTATFRVPLREKEYLLEYNGFAGYPTQFFNYKEDGEPYAIKKWWQDALPVNLETGVNNLDQNEAIAALAPYTNLVGTLVDVDTSQPLSDTLVDICVYEKQYEGGYSSCQWSYGITTDENGTYTITNQLRAGTHKVYFNKPPWNATIQGPNGDSYPPQYHDNVNPGQQVLGLAQQILLTDSTTNTLESKLQRGYRIGGLVTNASTTSPITNGGDLQVRGYAPEGTYLWTKLTWPDETGRYTITAESGTYLLEYGLWGYTNTWYDHKPNQAQSDVFDLTSGDNLNVNVSFEQPKQGTIAGTINNDAGANIGGVQVQAIDSNGNASIASTLDNGTYTLSLPVGNYQIEFRHSDYQTEYYNNAASQFTADQVLVTENTTTTINATLAPGISTNGTLIVQLEDGSGGPAYVNANLYLDQAVGGPNWQGNVREPSDWDPFTSTFTYTNVPAGQYKLYVEPLMQYESMWWAGNNDDDTSSGNLASDYYMQYAYDTAKVIEVVGGASEEISVDLMEPEETFCSDSSITGTVTREDNGTPATGWATLYDSFSSTQLGSIRSLDNGTYEFKCLQPGTYKVQFIPDNTDLIGEYWNDKKLLSTAQVIEIAEGDEPFIADAQLAAVPGRYMQVVSVKTSSGDPVSGIWVQTSGPNGTDAKTTDSMGQAYFTLIQGEEYRICTQPNGIYLRTCLSDPVMGTTPARQEVTIVVGEGGRIVGQVLDDTTNNLIQNFDVRVLHHLHETPIDNVQSISGVNGTYEISNLPAGTYKLQFNAWNYQSSYADAAIRWEDGKLITVGAGQTVREDERLTPLPPVPMNERGTITGRVTLDTNDQPAHDVRVELHRLNSSWNPVSSGRTDGNGTFRFPDISVGEYELRFIPPADSGFMSTWWEDALGLERTINLTAGEVLDASIILNRPTQSIKGRLLDRVTGAPVANTTGNIRIEPDGQANQAFVQPIETDQNGNYTAYILDYNTESEGLYKLWFNLDNEAYAPQWYVEELQSAQFDENDSTFAAEVTFGNEDEVSVVSRLQPYAVYQGTLVDKNSGSPLAYAEGWVQFFKQDEVGDYPFFVERMIKTDRDGKFTVAGNLFDGKYKVRFLNFKGYPGQWHDNGYRSSDLADPITLLPGTPPANSITTHLVPGTPVRGVLRDSVTGQPIGNARFTIRFFHAGNLQQSEEVSSESGRTDYPSGAFEVSVFPGTYMASIWLESGDYDNTWYDNHTVATATEFTVANDPVNLGTQDMRPRGIIRGKVTNTSGAGIGGATVRIIDASGNIISSGQTVQTAGEGGENLLVGEYLIPQVPAGNYRLWFTPPHNSNYLGEYHNDKDTLFQADTVGLAAGGLAVVNATLAEGRMLVVNVLDESGNADDPIPIGGHSELSLYDTASFDEDPIAPSDFDLATSTYTFTRLLDRKYRLFVNAPGYAPEWYLNIEPSLENFDSFNKATDIDLTNTNATIDVELAKEVGNGIIRGKVTDKDGNPIAGTNVRLLNALTEALVANDNFVDQGNYEFTNLPNGLYTLVFNAPGYASEFYNDQFSFEHATVVRIDDTTNQVTADAQLENAGLMGVTITDQAGNPLAGVGVNLTNLELGDGPWGNTDANGQILFADLPPGTYCLGIEAHGDYIGIEHSEHAVVANERTDVTIRMQRGGQIVGKILDHLTGLPLVWVDDADIQLFRGDAPQPVENVFWSWDVDDSGNYIIEGLPAGTYKVYYDVPFYRPSFARVDDNTPADQWANGKVITVVAGQSTIQDVSLWPEDGGTITGRVTLSTTGKGAANVRVEVFDAASGDLADDDDEEPWDITDDNGNYVIPGLEPNRNYLVRYMPPNNIGFAMEWYNNAATIQNATVIPLAANQVFVANTELAPVNGVITGRVTSSDRNEPLVGVEVWAYRKDNRSVAGRTTTEYRGTYQIKGLRPDVDYLVISEGDDDVYSGHWYNNKASWTVADTVRPTTASPVVTGIDFVLGKAGIEGYVTDSNGRGLANIPVWIYSEEFDTGWFEDEYLTDGSGYFRADGLLPGNYTIEAETTNDVMVTTYYNGNGGTTDWRYAKLVRVGTDGIQRADITMITGNTLSGRVVAEGTNTGLARVGVEVNGKISEIEKLVYTDANGNFTVTGLAPNDTYHFYLIPPMVGDAAKYPEQWHDRTLLWHDAQDVTLPYAGDLIIQMSENPASIPLDLYDVDLQPTYASKTGVPGSTVRHTLTVQNIGAMTDTYQLDYLSNWATVITPYPVVGPIGPGETVEVLVDVAVPAGVAIGDNNEVMLNMTSQTNPGVTKGAILVTTAASQAYGVLVAPQSMVQRTTAGSVVSYTVEVINTGNISDSYDLAVAMGSGNTWPVTVNPQQVGPLNPGQRASVAVQVTVPANAANGDTGVATLTATSQGDPTQSSNSTLTTTVSEGGAVETYGVLLAPSGLDRLANPGTTVNYFLTVVNNGTMADSYTIGKTSNHGWSITAPATVGPLQPGATASLQVAVAVPAGAAEGTVDETTVTATSVGDSTKSAQSKLTTTVTEEAIEVRGVAISPKQVGKDVRPGATTIYQLEVFNTGNTSDTLTINARNFQWTTTVSPTAVTLAGGARAIVSVQVTVPANAPDGQSDQATITVSSQSDPTQTDNASLTTTSRIAALTSRMIVAPSEVEGSGIAGMRSRYTLQVWNLGTTADTYTVGLSGNAWSTQLSQTSLSIEPGTHATIVVSVTIPLSARGGDEDSATIQVTSQSDPTNTGSSVVKTQVAHETIVVLPGASITTSDNRVKVIVPATGRMIRIVYTPLVKPSHPLGTINTNSADVAATVTPTGVSYFALKAYDAQTGEVIETLNSAVELQVSYTSEQLQSAGVSDASTLGVLFWNGTQWVKQSSQNDQTNRIVTFQTTKLDDFAVVSLGDGKARVFLPVVQR